MKCNYIQNLIIENTDVTDPKQNSIVDKHLAQCDKCAKFAKNTAQTRRFIRNIELFEPPSYLIDSTMKRCNNVLSGQRENLVNTKNMLSRTPRFLWIILTLLISLTLLWFFALIKADGTSAVTASHIAWAIIILIQNVIMLLLTPLLLNRILLKINGSQLLLRFRSLTFS
jgi:predicted anti-sigma-YlaC factor YlaD